MNETIPQPELEPAREVIATEMLTIRDRELEIVYSEGMASSLAKGAYFATVFSENEQG